MLETQDRIEFYRTDTPSVRGLRIPRPKGFSKLRTTKAKYETAARAYLDDRSSFGTRIAQDTATFRQLGIPLHVWRAQLISQLETQLAPRDLGLGSLYHLQQGTEEIDWLAQLLREVLTANPEADTILKEMNSLITNRVRLAEGFVKTTQILKEIPTDPEEEAHWVTPTQVIELIESKKKEALESPNRPELLESPNPVVGYIEDLSQEVEGTPELDPIPVTAVKKGKDKVLKAPPLPKLSDVVISPY